MSNALVEAMACGTAIVATDIPANQEICTNEVNSLLVKPADSQGLAEVIIKLFDSQQLAENLGKQARKVAEENLSVETMASRYINLYREIIQDN
jgi:glycosyltransferase involved in cell wall biosynthesis